MTLKEQILKLQTYKMFKEDDTIYVERDDVLKLLEQQSRDCRICIHSYPTDIDFENEIKRALEQQPCEDVLDKIRAEIESQRKEVSKKQSEDEGLSNYYFGLNDGLKDARDIIDKYKKGMSRNE